MIKKNKKIKIYKLKKFRLNMNNKLKHNIRE